MCNSIILPDGTEIELLPMPITDEEYAKPIQKQAKPKHAMTCLCQFPEEHIEAWIKHTFPHYKMEKTPFGWELTNKGE